jgi:cation:H+ antiporter
MGDGSLYHAVGSPDYFWISAALLVTGILIGGLILRQRQGPARIGAESVLLLGDLREHSRRSGDCMAIDRTG